MSHDQATEQTLKEHRDHHLMTAQRLSEGLGTPGLKVIEVTTHLKGLPSGDFTGVSGRGDYEAGHIPGAYYLDLQQDLSDAGSDFRFTVPSVAQFEAVMRHAGIAESDTVVVYAANHPMWACRAWWLFKVFGHERGTSVGWRIARLAGAGLCAFDRSGLGACERLPSSLSP